MSGPEILWFNNRANVEARRGKFEDLTCDRLEQSAIVVDGQQHLDNADLIAGTAIDYSVTGTVCEPAAAAAYTINIASTHADLRNGFFKRITNNGGAGSALTITSTTVPPDFSDGILYQGDFADMYYNVLDDGTTYRWSMQVGSSAGIIWEHVTADPSDGDFVRLNSANPLYDGDEGFVVPAQTMSNVAGGIRCFFDGSTGAFRGGRTAAGQWDVANRGVNSAGFGISTTASGANSAAFGNSTTASNTDSVAFGNGTIASGADSAAFGDSATASGTNSVAFGDGTISSNAASVTFGNGTTASGTNSAAFGIDNTVSGTDSSILGGYDHTVASDCSVICAGGLLGFGPGFGNTIGANNEASFIGAGRENSIEAQTGTGSANAVVTGEGCSIGRLGMAAGNQSFNAVLTGGSNNIGITNLNAGSSYNAIICGGSNLIDVDAGQTGGINHALIGGGQNNIVRSTRSAILCGGSAAAANGNTVGWNQDGSWIGGGRDHTISDTNAAGATRNGNCIVTGLTNVVGDNTNYACDYNVVCGGTQNDIGVGATTATSQNIIGAGTNNVVLDGENSGVFCGTNNQVTNSNNAAVVCGDNNLVGSAGFAANSSGVLAGSAAIIGQSTASPFCAILCGLNNRIETDGTGGSVIGAGQASRISCDFAGILAGENQHIDSDCGWSAIVAGDSNRIGTGTSSQYNFIGAGDGHNIGDTDDTFRSGIVAGANNRIDSGERHFIGGGTSNAIVVAAANNNGIVCGETNTISSANAVDSCIVCGMNHAINFSYSAVVCGTSNIVNANRACIIGGDTNEILAGGNGSIILASSQIDTDRTYSVFFAGNKGILTYGAPNGSNAMVNWGDHMWIGDSVLNASTTALHLNVGDTAPNAGALTLNPPPGGGATEWYLNVDVWANGANRTAYIPIFW